MSSRSLIPSSHGISAAAGSLLVAALLATTPTAAIDQQAAPNRPEANPADVKSPDAIVSAVYEAVSGSAGEERDWDRLRSLFLPEARLIPTLV